MFRFSPKILDTLKYFGLYKFAHRMETDTVLTAREFHRCGQADWDKTAVKDGFMSYDVPPREVYGHSEEAVQAKKRVRGVEGAPATVTLEAVPVTFLANVSRVALASIQQGYDD